MAEAAAEDDDCDDKKLMSCIGIDTVVCESFRADIIGECTLPMARDILTSDEDLTENLELKHAQCTLTLAESKYEISPKRYLGCMPEGTYEQPELIEEWLKNR